MKKRHKFYVHFMLLLEQTTLEKFRDRKNKMVSTVHES